MQADSSRSIQPRYALGERSIGGLAIAIGNSNAVMATRKSEMPSTPRYHEISSAPNQLSLLVNWKPALALPVLNATTIQATKPNSITAAATASRFAYVAAKGAGNSATAQAAP